MFGKMTTPLWTLKNVTLRGTHRPRLNNVCCEIQPGITAVVGDSGAGKSSLLNLFVGFEHPDQGEIVCHCAATRGQLGVYWLPPGDGLWSHLSVQQHLEIVRTPATDAGSMIDQLLTQFDLSELRRARPDDLSQGERARLAMARALASQAKVLVLDEPLVHTSILRQTNYWQWVREHAAQQQTSLVIASHDLETIAREADQLLILEAGQLAYSGPLEPTARSHSSGSASELLGRILNYRQQHAKT
ncbi:MAG: fbpC [Planctomycetaceae bacterium]|nr:fbpC [Planctomycetaceae bacterium]